MSLTPYSYVSNDPIADDATLDATYANIITLLEKVEFGQVVASTAYQGFDKQKLMASLMSVKGGKVISDEMFSSDLVLMIALGTNRGSNLSKLIEKTQQGSPLHAHMTRIRTTYDIRDKAAGNTSAITLPRVAICFPKYSVMAAMRNPSPSVPVAVMKLLTGENIDWRFLMCNAYGSVCEEDLMIIHLLWLALNNIVLSRGNIMDIRPGEPSKKLTESMMKVRPFLTSAMSKPDMKAGQEVARIVKALGVKKANVTNATEMISQLTDSQEDESEEYKDAYEEDPKPKGSQPPSKPQQTNATNKRRGGGNRS